MTFKTANTAYDQNFTVDYQYPEVEGDSNIWLSRTNIIQKIS